MAYMGKNGGQYKDKAAYDAAQKTFNSSKVQKNYAQGQANINKVPTQKKELSLGVRQGYLDGSSRITRLGKPSSQSPTYQPPTYNPQDGAGTGTGAGAGTGTGTVAPAGGTGGSQQAMNYINELKQNPGMTPEQLQLLRNQAANQSATQRQGSDERIRSQMAKSGLSGSGIQTGALLQSEMANAAGLQNSLSNIGLQDANMQRENAMRLAGLGVEAGSNIDRTGLGYAGLQNQAQMQQNQLAQQQGQYQQDFGWQKYLQDVQNYQYGQQQNQYQKIWNQLGL